MTRNCNFHDSPSHGGGGVFLGEKREKWVYLNCARTWPYKSYGTGENAPLIPGIDQAN